MDNVSLTESDINSEFERDINELIASIDIEDIKTFDDTNKTNIEILDVIYGNFNNYKQNLDHKQSALEILYNNYEYVEDFQGLKPFTALYYIDLREFYNLKLKYLGYFISFNKYNNMVFKKNRLIGSLKPEKCIFFKKIANKEKAKMILLESIKDIS